MQTQAWVLSILDTFHRHGYEAVLVGGCVRDSLLGKTPADYDIATSAATSEIEALFEKTARIGQFGTVCVILPEGCAEVTPFRTEGKYDDFRHPAAVHFGATLAEDLKRRDFTVNALCFDGRRIIDLCGGAQDLHNRIIRAVGDPAERFEEDPLRILRAFRFAAMLGFTIEDVTRQAALEKAALLRFVSAERIGAELGRLMTADAPEKGMEIFGRLPIETDEPLPQVPVCDLAPQEALRWAGYFYRCGRSADQAEAFLRSIKRPGAVYKTVRNVLSGCEKTLDAPHLLTCYGAENARRIAQISAPDQLAELDRLLESGACYKREMLALNGHDLLSLGVSKENMKSVIGAMLRFVLENPSENTKESLLRFVKEMQDETE